MGLNQNRNKYILQANFEYPNLKTYNKQSYFFK